MYVPNVEAKVSKTTWSNPLRDQTTGWNWGQNVQTSQPIALIPTVHVWCSSTTNSQHNWLSNLRHSQISGEDNITTITGKSSSSVKNSSHFAEKISGWRIPVTTLRVSFDVKLLFTNVPVGEVLTIIKVRLEQDTEWTHGPHSVQTTYWSLLSSAWRRHTSSMEKSSTNKKTGLPWDLHYPQL